MNFKDVTEFLLLLKLLKQNFGWRISSSVLLFEKQVPSVRLQHNAFVERKLLNMLLISHHIQNMSWCSILRNLHPNERNLYYHFMDDTCQSSSKSAEDREGSPLKSETHIGSKTILGA